MPFVKGDPRINREGRPRNAEPDLLRQALDKEGEKRGISFWEKVAEYAFRDRQVMIAVIKKFVPDTTEMNITGDALSQRVVQIVYSGVDKPKEDNGNRLAEVGSVEFPTALSTEQ